MRRMADDQKPGLPGDAQAPPKRDFSRREFLKGATAGAATAAVLGAGIAYNLWPDEPAPVAQAPELTSTTTPVSTPAPAPAPPAPATTAGWGKVGIPYPTGNAMIECDEMKCVGCGICEWACSMHHFGVMNKELSRIRVRKYLLPLPKGVQSSCAQCQEAERECQKACPPKVAAIYYDEKLKHIVLDKEKCTACMLCVDACQAGMIRVYEAVQPEPFMCDLCDVKGDGNRDPQCVSVCPAQALYFKNETPNHLWRQSMDEKAELIAKRLYPLRKESMGYPGWGV